MAHQAVDRPHRIAHGAQRASELGERREPAGGLAMRRRVEGHDPEAGAPSACVSPSNRPARLPQPCTSTTVGPAPHSQAASVCPSLSTLNRRPEARNASSPLRGSFRGGVQKIVSAQRAAIPGATDPTVVNTARSASTRAGARLIGDGRGWVESWSALRVTRVAGIRPDPGVSRETGSGAKAHPGRGDCCHPVPLGPR